MGPDAMIFVFWMLSFKPAFSLSSFTPQESDPSPVKLPSLPLCRFIIQFKSSGLVYTLSMGGEKGTSLVVQMVKNLPAIPETQVQSLDREDALEKRVATHSSILAWRIPWTEEPDRTQSMGSQRVRQNWVTNTTIMVMVILDHCQSGNVLFYCLQLDLENVWFQNMNLWYC